MGIRLQKNADYISILVLVLSFFLSAKIKQTFGNIKKTFYSLKIVLICDQIIYILELYK